MSSDIPDPADFIRRRNLKRSPGKAVPPAANEAMDDRKALPALDLVEPCEVDVMGELPLERYFTKAYFLGTGQKSWHSSWTNRYAPGGVSFDLHQLKRSAEERRTQGCVFRIESIPVLVLRYEHGAFGMAPINEKSECEYDALAEDMGMYGVREFWKALPNSASDWLLAFRLGVPLPAAAEHSARIHKAMSGGTPHPLVWHQLEGGGYRQFFKFAQAFLARLPKPAPEGAVRNVHAAGLRVA